MPKGGIIGHETFAEVAEAPAAAASPRATASSSSRSAVCGACRACTMGAPYLCYKLQVRGVDVPGGMQEYWAVPTERIIKVPASLSDDQAAVIEPLAIATHDVDAGQA